MNTELSIIIFFQKNVYSCIQKEYIMAETFRKTKIENYIKKLESRKEILNNQITQHSLTSLRENLIIQIQTIDFILEELSREFDITR